MDNEKKCYNCGYCKEHLAVDYCQCRERNRKRGYSEIKDLNEADTCEYYDDDNWMK